MGEKQMAAGDSKTAGISVGGIIVIAGILAIIFWSFWIGLVIVLIGLLAFGGFAKGKWY
jgi:tetrahydromethanopterin S-methyltransferase subunit B